MLSDPIELVSSRLIIRSAGEADQDAIAACWAESNMQKYQPAVYRNPPAAWKSPKTSGSAYDYRIFTFSLKQSCLIMGVLTCIFYPDTQLVLLGWYLKPRYEGQGYATEAGLTLRNYLFEGCQILALLSHSFAHHTASRRIMEKLGMTQQKLACKQQLGLQWYYREWRPIVSYGLRRENWQDLIRGK